MPTTSSRRPRIGMLTADSTPCIGGIGHHVESLSAALRSTGFDVRIFDVRSLGAYRFGRNISASLCMGSAVRRWIADERIDVIHVHGGPGGVLPTGTFGVPCVMTANHTYMQQAGVPGQAWKRMLVAWERRGYDAADRIICVSPDTRDAIVHRYGVAAGKTVVAGCGFALGPWIAADRDVRVADTCVFVGRPQERKGWDLLQDAWLQIRREYPVARLHVAGFTDVPMDGATYHGRLSDDALRMLIGSSKLLLVPSRVEGFGLAAAEACAAGTPVVGFDVPGLRTTVASGKTGVLVPVDVTHFAAVTIGLLRDAREWDALHEGCRAARERFDAASEAAAYAAVYAAVYSAA